eukprot:g2314.t1
MGLDLGSGEVKHYDHGPLNTLNQSIFINGNLARVLMGAYRLTGNATHLAEALRWCDAFVAQQVPVTTAAGGGAAGGFWGTGYPTNVPLADGEIYLGDTGTAATTLAVCHELTADSAQRSRFEAALRRYLAFVVGGCTAPGCGAARRGARPSPGFVNASAGGALGCGYYKGHLSGCPYVIATATTGAAFAGELLNIVGAGSPAGARCASMVGDAVRYMASLVSAANGTIPYVIDCEGADWSSWPLDTLSYVTEGVVAAHLHGGAELRPVIDGAFNATAEWLLANQNAAGYWGSFDHKPDMQRSPRVATLLALRAQTQAAAAAAGGAAADPRLAAALARYVRYLVAQGDGSYGVKDLLNLSGFVGLALVDMLRFGATFGTPRPAALT